MLQTSTKHQSKRMLKGFGESIVKNNYISCVVFKEEWTGQSVPKKTLVKGVYQTAEWFSTGNTPPITISISLYPTLHLKWIRFRSFTHIYWLVCPCCEVTPAQLYLRFDILTMGSVTPFLNVVLSMLLFATHH